MLGERLIGRATLVTALIGATAPVVRAQPGVELVHVVSSRPSAVSGDEALVELNAPGGSRWSVRLQGRMVSAAFHRSQSGDLLALLTGLQPGSNALEVRIDGAIRSRITLVSHPLSGPVFSGPQQQPFLCQTDLNGLGPPLDTQCRAKTIVEYYYKSTGPSPVGIRTTWIKSLEELDSKGAYYPPPGFAQYDPQHPPTDVAQTVTAEGIAVPYIVRREIGVLNRAVYDIRLLHRPGEPLPTPWARGRSGWNGRLVYEFGGGCVAGYRQGGLIFPASHEAVLALGYAVATSTFNIFANNCNDVLSAETVSMVKEHFIKEYGPPVHTIGWGDSAGAMQQYLIAQNYPGLLNGIIPYISFPDTVTYVSASSDCTLLAHAFDTAAQPWTDEQKSAVTGFATWRVCQGQGGYAVSARGCDPAIPKGSTYDPIDRPKGVRCDIYDNEINVFGRDPKTGFGARPLDNVGVQYGLSALNGGEIDAEQFIDLNQRVGGLDQDGNVVYQRTEASSDVIQRAYRNGVVLTGGGGLPETPIIDWRWYSDDQGDNHDSFRSFVTRARLVAANGAAANQIILIDPPANTAVMTLIRLSDPDPRSSLFARRERDLVQQMDHWLDAIAADRSPEPLAAKIVRNRPADLRDSCWTPAGKRIMENLTYDGPGQCKQIYRLHADPRIVAGGPLTDDVLKCTLKPISATDYAQPLTLEQLRRLKTVFPAGVCDYARPGVGQEISHLSWRQY